MKKYSDIITLRESKPAYNIKEEQNGEWNEFIANEQFNNILKRVIDSVFNNNADDHKSFWISGTYGTGKSHAGAVIKHLLCDPVSEIEEYVNDEYGSNKYDLLRNNLFKLREQKKLFPVNMYGQNYIAHKDDLSLQLQLAISSALKKANIPIDTKTDFENYVTHVESQPHYWDMIIEQNASLKSVTPNRQKLISALKNGDTNILSRLKDALRDGGFHIRLDSTNLNQWFYEVQNKLADVSDYDGLLIIWDEFTDVMTSDIGISLLVALQELTEIGMSSENNSYFLFISHPSALNSLKEDEREKTKGRYHYMSYNMETVSAFKIMSRKFKVLDQDNYEYNNLKSDFYADAEILLDKYIEDSNSSSETKEDIKNLFPLHPSTANLAAYYAREAGSSSRSVFEFLGSNQAVRDFFNSEEHFMNKHTITADYLWDYVLEVFNSNVTKFGAVTERFNSRRLQIEEKGWEYNAVFKGILLLNALNNIANNITVTPSEENIKNLFIGTIINEQIDIILDYLNDESIIQRAPGGLYSIQYSALPTAEIENEKQKLRTTQFKFTQQVVKFGDTTAIELAKSIDPISREKNYQFYSLDSNEHTLLNQIENGYKQAKSYEIFLALLFARNNEELNTLKDIANRASQDDRFSNITFVVFDTIFTDNNYERFIEYQANASCARSHGFADQNKAHVKSASDLLREWIIDIRRKNFTYYLRGESDTNSVMKFSSVINTCVSPTIFSNGAESLNIIQTRSSRTYWKKASVKATVDNIISFDTKSEISERCNGVAMHVIYLLQDSVDDNLQWISNIDSNHPLKLVSEFVDNKFKHTNKNTSFNLADRLIDLSRPPFGLYQSHAGMGMVAFAMRKYIKQIYDLNGKPRETQHIVEDIVELFKSFESGNPSNKLNFMFESKEAGELSRRLIKAFKLKTLKEYSDISSLTDARWAITHAFSEETQHPLWVLKYINDPSNLKDEVKILIDNVLKVCEDSGTRNPKLIVDTLTGLKNYEFEFGNILNSNNNFRDGLSNFIKSVELVDVRDEEMTEVIEYIKRSNEGAIGLWQEIKLIEDVKNWRLEKNRLNQPTHSPIITPTVSTTTSSSEQNWSNQIEKRTKAKSKVSNIDKIDDAKNLLNRLCELNSDEVLDIINNYV